MKNRLTSYFLLFYLALQMAGFYAGSQESMRDASQSEAVVSHAPAMTQTLTNEVGDAAQIDINHATMQNCSDCSDSAHCLFGSCPSLPSEWQTAARIWISLPVQPALAGIPQPQIPENLYRPPIFC